MAGLATTPEQAMQALERRREYNRRYYLERTKPAREAYRQLTSPGSMVSATHTGSESSRSSPTGSDPSEPSESRSTQTLQECLRLANRQIAELHRQLYLLQIGQR